MLAPTHESESSVYYNNPNTNTKKTTMNTHTASSTTAAINKKTNLYNSSCKTLLILVLLALFGIFMIFYGVVNSISVTYVHQKCCTVSWAHCRSDETYCSYMIDFPRLGSAKLLQDPKKGFGLTCSAEGNDFQSIGATVSIQKYTYSSLDQNLPRTVSNVDCYTDKNENYASIEPYSESYPFHIGVGIICVTGPILFMLIKVVGGMRKN